MFLRFIVVAAILAVAVSDFLVANYYLDVATCASGLSAQAAIPMSKCITMPEIPPSLNVTLPLKSFKSTCTQQPDGSVLTTNKVYATSSSCSGVGVPVKETIPAGCQTGGVFTCVADWSTSEAVTKAWPAVGAYFGDSTCGAFDVQVGFASDTCVPLSGKKGSGSVKAVASATTLEAEAWSGVSDCSGAAKKTYSLPLGQCQAIDMPSIKSEHQREFYKTSLHALSALLGSVIDIEVSPALMSWLHSEIERSELGLQGGATVYAKGGVAGKL
jgi:hypothetical protein